jgi:hypothetical protein
MQVHVSQPGATAVISGTWEGPPDSAFSLLGMTANGYTDALDPEWRTGQPQPGGPGEPTMGTWDATVHFYHTGTINLTITLTAPTTPSARAQDKAQAVIVMDAPVPDLLVLQPRPNPALPVPPGGASLPLQAQTRSDLGPRTVSWNLQKTSHGTAVNGGTTNLWTGTVEAAPMPLGAQPLTVTVTCTQAPDVTNSVTVPLTLVDNTGPDLALSPPLPAGNSLSISADTDATALVPFRGTLSDTQSGVASLTSVPGGPIPVAADGSWSSTLTLSPGAHQVTFVAADNAGNQTTTAVTVTVAPNASPASRETVLSAETAPAPETTAEGSGGPPQILATVAVPGISPPAATVSTPEPPGGGMPTTVAEGNPPPYMVTGTVFSPVLPGIGGLTVQLVDKNVGGDQALASTQTSSDGSYAFEAVTIDAAYLQEHNKTQPDLQVHVSGASGMLASSAVAWSAPLTVTLDVTLPEGAAGLPSEYEILTANLAAAYPGSLSALQDGNGRQDITYLANKTGWDARAVALAALADQFSQLTAPAPVTPPPLGQTPALPIPAVNLRPEFYYALFRTGLPASADTLFRADPPVVQAIWEQAAKQGIIPAALTAEIPNAVRNFQTLSAARLLTAAPPVGLSTLDEMLRSTLPDTAQREQFAQLHAEHAANLAEFWPALEQQFGAPATERLRFMGQLYLLTLNNEPLVTSLLAAEARSPLQSTADLAARGYYDPAKWAPLIATAIPPSIPGATAQEQATNYARLLAAQVRLSFPTTTLASQILTGVIPVVGTSDTANLVADFLTQNQDTFEIGVEPVQAYLARTGAPAPPPSVVAQVSRLQRVYQLTPDDTSMAVLLRHNLDSAFAITRYDAASFTRAFQDKLGGASTAAAIHARARQIVATTLSIAVAYLGSRVNPGTGGRVPLLDAVTRQQSTTGYPVVAYPTLENLFGSLDYCDCQDCGSILSPAAYLVDLLNYTDQPNPAAGGSNPQDVLLARRPDLQYLPLTCANTNTALPYIDLVNETLEYFVANGLSMDGYQGHDTSDTITSAELIASPQYVDDAAYATLQDAFFPPPLPFSRPLALLRLHMNALGTQLPDAMAALRANDHLENTDSPASYGWTDILIELLGISRDEYRMFTDPSLQLGDLWGIPASGSPLATLQAMSVRDLSRRLGVFYDDLVSIIQTQFINANTALIPRLTRLKAPFTTLKQLHDNLGTANSIAGSFKQSLPAGLDATEYGGAYPTDYDAVVSWVTGPAIYPRIMDIITIADPAGNTVDCSGANLHLRYSNPDNTANQLTAADFTRLIRLVRLWQKLGPLLEDPSDAASIQHTDEILTALYPATPPTAEAGFKTLLARLGFLFRVMEQLSLTAAASLDQLLACWAPIGTAGTGSLYQAMFLTPTLLQQDPGAQTATVGPTVNAGDVLVTTINSQTVSSYSVQQSDVLTSDPPATVASAIAAAINAATVVDPVTGVPVKGRFLATTAANVITIEAGFTLACSAAGVGSGTASETYSARAPSPLTQTATVAGAPTAGDTLTTTIDGVPVGYTVQADDTVVTIATGIAAAVNATTVQDRYSGLPLNALVVASSAANVVTITAAGAGTPFTLTCGITPAAAEGYAAAPSTPASQTAAITATTVTQGDTLVTTINQAAVAYTAGPNDTNANSLAAHIASYVSASVQVDPATGLPVSSIVRATSNQNVITFTAVDPMSQFTLNCNTTTGTEAYTTTGQTLETATATIIGPIPAGATLMTTINSLPLVRVANAGDTAAMVATGIAGDINAATASDPSTGLPLNSVVSASASGSVITVTGLSPTTPFTLAAFLSPSQYTAGRRTPPFADDGYGDLLTDTGQTLFGHQPTLCAAFNLTGAEFALIAGALGFGPSTHLTLDNVSALFRFGWLAHTLGLSVLEFLRLRQFTGLDPFAPLDPGKTTPAEPPVIRFIRLLNACANAGLTTNQVLYLTWNQDITGTSAPSVADVTGLASALRADFAAVEAQFTVQDDPDGSIAKGLMTLVYGSAASDFFFGLLNNTFTTAVPYSSPLGQPTLSPQIVAASGGQLSYNDLSKQLSYAGLLSSSAQAAIDAAITVSTTDHTNVPAGTAATFTPTSMTNIYAGAALLIDTGAAQETVIVASYTAATFTASTVNAHNGTGTPFPITNDPALVAAISTLAAASQQAVAPFFAGYPELLPLYNAYAASTDPLPARRTALLAAFLPILKNKRKQEQALASVTSAAGCDPSFAPGLLTDAAITHADADATAPAITDLTAIEQQGLSARFFLGDDPAAPADITADSVPVLSYGQTATVAGTITAGEILTTTINGIAISYQVGAADTTLTQLTSNIAAAINQATAVDPVSNLPIGRLVAATANGNVITITGTDPSGAHTFFKLAVSVSAGATDFTAGSQLPAGKGGGPVAGVWSGYITAPQDGDYDIAVVADPAATVTLQIGQVLLHGVVPADGRWENPEPIPLVAGQLTPVTLTAASLRTTLSVSWQGLGLGWQLIPGQYLYSGTLVSRLSDTYIQFLKATSLASGLSLTAPELAYLATSLPTTAGGSWLNDLTATGDPDPATSANLCGVLANLLDFARIKGALSPSDDRLLAVLQAPGGLLAGQQPALLSLTGWSQASVTALLTKFFGSQDLASLGSVPNFRRVYDAFALVRSCGLPAATLISAITNAPSPDTVSALQSALRARYAETDWLTVVQPVNDAARVQQRDALVAYILQQLGDAYTPPTITLTLSAPALIGATTLTCGSVTDIVPGMLVTGTGIAPGTTVTWTGPGAIAISTGTSAALPTSSTLTITPTGNPFNSPDSLLQYILVDAEMQPPVQTSRIRLALSQVQLFIERVIRNLEPQVSAADIDPSRWEWMKRYRLWQSNRKVFLWPENWLYPELRDNQSPFFQQMMSSLLQGDITDDAAASSYLDYLTSLEEVAKLEPCGLYYQPGDADVDETSYVVARTAGAHRKYYFRQLQSGSWTPWTQVMIDCEDMPLTPIVWNGRLFLFWLKVIKQGSTSQIQIATTPASGTTLSGLAISDLNSSVTTAAGTAMQKNVVVQAVLFWTEYYNGKWQPTKTSDLNLPTTVGTYDPSSDGSFEAIRNQVRIVPAPYTGTNPALTQYNAQFSLPDNALVLAITVADAPYNIPFGDINYKAPSNGTGGFILHNTHSLPIRFEDLTIYGQYNQGTVYLGLPQILDIPATSRSFFPGPGIPYTGAFQGTDFIIGYQNAPGSPYVYAFALFTFDWASRRVEPQPALAGIWDAPFIYEDRRNLFYVTTTQSQVPASGLQGFGLLTATPIGFARTAKGIEPLVLPRRAVPAAKPEVATIAAVGGTAPAVQRLLATTPGIKAALFLPAAVSYQGQLISPTGSIATAGTGSNGTGE